MHRQYLKRRNNYSTLPSAPSVSGAITAAGASASGSNLAINHASSSVSYSAPSLANDFTVTVTPSIPAPVTATPSAAAASGSSASNSSSNNFPVTTVVGICVGAFVAAGLFICFSVWFYRRSNDRSARKALARPVRRRERSQTWHQLGNDPDRWEGKDRMREIEKGSSEKAPITLKNMPSQTVFGQPFAAKSASDTLSSDHDANPFAAYHPNLATELSQPPRAFLSHKEGFGSWDGSTTVVSADDCYASLKSVHIESGQISPANPAKMTPPTTTSIHRWESAEIVVPDGTSDIDESTLNPFADTPQLPAKIKNHSNPFFGAQDARQIKPVRKNLERAHDPFADKHALVVPSAEPIPRFSYSQTDSVVSTSSASATDRAMQSLITALNLPPEEVQNRLRVASMQSSQMSRYSYMTSDSAT